MSNANLSVNINSEFISYFGSRKDNIAISEEVNLSLSIYLFTKNKVTLARAAELARKSLGDFINILVSQNISWMEYTEEEKKMDDETIFLIMEEKRLD